MTESFPNWITEQMIKGINGFNLDAYLMALEGWRRGLSLTWYYDPSEVTDLEIIGFNPLAKTFSLYSHKNNKMHYFYRSRGDKVANEAVRIVHDKHLAKKHLNKANIPTPKGVLFEKNIDNKAISSLIGHLTYPLVVKPSLGSLGKGVVTNIQSETELFEAIKYVKDNYEYDDIIVEEFVGGTEYRIYVVGDKVVAATKRLPANVIGDGNSSIEKLIDAKNVVRKENPYLKKKDITIDKSVRNFLDKKDLSLSSIPAQGEHIQLKGQSNISAGGDPVDATDELNEKVKDIAIEAVKSIPGLLHAGVDMIVNNDEMVVLEVNATADVSMHMFPQKGIPRNVPAEIINYYYPDTQENNEGREQLYFEFKDIQNILRKKFAQELTLTDAPKGTLKSTRYIIAGKVQKVGYRKWIRKEAIKRGLHGYTRNLENGRVVIIVAGEEKAVDDFKNRCAKGPSKSKVKKVKELEWKLPVKLGFEIRKSK